jgi:adenosylcobinamide kinase/adenosylcobinamide-phosphate guanylyltransferase
VSSPLVVILGGTRSGKSRLGRDRAHALANGGPVAYVATALPGDRELDERIALHQRDRPAAWRTVEPTLDLPDAIRALEPATTILLDGLTLWLSRLVEEPTPDVFSVVDGPVEALRAALETHEGSASFRSIRSVERSGTSLELPISGSSQTRMRRGSWSPAARYG